VAILGEGGTARGLAARHRDIIAVLEFVEPVILATVGE
jgi:hypothetical protein